MEEFAKSYITLKDAGKEYDVKADTLRSYITRKQVIPEGKAVKLGRQWFISREWMDENYEKRK